MSIFAKKKGWGGLLSLVIAARMPVLVMPAVLDGVGIGGLQQRLVHAEVEFVVFAGGFA